MKLYLDEKGELHIDGQNKRYYMGPSNLPFIEIDKSAFEYHITIENFCLQAWPTTRWQRFCAWLGGLNLKEMI